MPTLRRIVWKIIMKIENLLKLIREKCDKYGIITITKKFGKFTVTARNSATARNIIVLEVNMFNEEE